MVPKKGKGEKSKKLKGEKGKKAEETLPPKLEFIEFTYVYENEDREIYRALIEQIRNGLGERGRPQNEVRSLPKDDEVKKLYVRIRFVSIVENEPRFCCAVILRAWDLYLVGFQNEAGKLFDVRPDEQQDIEVTEQFSTPGVDFQGAINVTLLQFHGSYPSLMKLSKLKDTAKIPIGHLILHKSVRDLAAAPSDIDIKTKRKETAAPLPADVKIKRDEPIAKAISVMVLMISEAVRMNNIMNFLVRKFESRQNMELGDDLSPYLNEWGKISGAIRDGDPNKTLEGLKLRFNRRYLSTVEQARTIIAIMPYE